MKRPTKNIQSFDSEAHLVDSLAEWARAADWPVYFEVDGWDALLVVAPDFYIGVEAKLRATFAVLEQAHFRDFHGLKRGKHSAVDSAVVLVPHSPRGFSYVARELDLHVLHPPFPENFGRQRFLRELEFRKLGEHQRLKLPEYQAPDARGGIPSPGGITRWRIAAVKFCQAVRAEGFTTRKDIERAGLSPTFWLRQGSEAMFIPDGKRGRSTVYKLVRPEMLPDVGWEWLADELSKPG